MFNKDDININPQLETEKIIHKIKEDVRKLKKRGAVVGVSGGIDSAVVMALCAQALGSDKVLAIMLPEKESDEENLILCRKLTKKYNVHYIIEDLTAALTGFGCYSRRDKAIQKVFPEYDNSYKMKILLPQNILEKDNLNMFYLKIISPEGEEKIERLPIKEYQEIVAASNFKQRSRMAMLYHHAEILNYAVAGTPNKNEHAQGFFVKYGDSGADLKPIIHLFKTQVYQIAKYLDIPIEIQQRKPTTDTYTAEQTQEEFFFRLPFNLLDRIWYGWELGIPNEEIAVELQLNPQQVQNVINDIQRKIKTTEYLRQEPL
jgi:NAD+ synthase